MTIPDLTLRPSRSSAPIFWTRASSALLLVLGATLAVAQTPPAKKPVSLRSVVKAPNVAAGQGTHTYDIPILKNVAFAQPTNQWSYFFELRPGVRLLGNSFVEVDYDASPLLRSTEGSISVYLNNVPVQSKRVGQGVGLHAAWRVDLPLKYFKPGTFNELKIISRQRTLDGPCRDFDNSGNWLKFLPGCRLHLVRLDPPVFPLYSYPFPYLDLLETNPVRASWVIPGSAKPEQIGEALGLASDWGQQDIVHGLGIRLTMGGHRPGQNVDIGGAGDSDSRSLSDKEGFIKASAGGKPGNSRLYIGGAGQDGVHAARKALSYPDMVAQMRGFSTAIEAEPVAEASTLTTRLGSFSFTELGFPTIQLRGAFHQVASIAVQRPVRVDLGRESFINLHFRHSATLNSLRSILTIVVNGINIGSARLDDSNANGAWLKVPIPITELAKNLWQIDLEAYHDLAAIDCSRSYDEVAWTVIEGDSSLDLYTGALVGQPYLEAFPYLIGKDGVAPKRVPIALSQSQSDAELSAAAVIAARAAQQNRHSFDWDVTVGNVVMNKSSSIAIGYYDEGSRFNSAAGALLIAPEGNGKFKVDPKLHLIESALSGGAVLQAVKMPGQDGVLYVLLGQDDAAIARFAELLANPVRSLNLTGQVAILTSDSKLITLSPISDKDRLEIDTSAQDQYTPQIEAVHGFPDPAADHPLHLGDWAVPQADSALIGNGRTGNSSGSTDNMTDRE